MEADGLDCILDDDECIYDIYITLPRYRIQIHYVCAHLANENEVVQKQINHFEAVLLRWKVD